MKKSYKYRYFKIKKPYKYKYFRIKKLYKYKYFKIEKLYKYGYSTKLIVNKTYNVYNVLNIFYSNDN